MSNISIKKATMINAFSKYFSLAINIIFVAILARIITPEDHGLISLVVVFTSFFTVISDLGIGTSIIQNKDLSQDDVSRLFGLTFWIGLILIILFFFLSFVVAFIYKDNRYITIFSILTIAVFFTTINVVPNALLLREKKFLSIGIRVIVITLLTGILTVLAALSGWKHYALVLQSILLAAGSFIWNYASNRTKVLFTQKKSTIDKIKSYSGFHFAFNVLNYFARNFDSLLIGKSLGTEPLAYYNKSYTLMLYPISNLTFVITPILHPILSDYQNNKDYIYEIYIKVLKVLSLMGVFISVFSFFAAKEIIMIVFGDQWIPAIMTFKWLSLSIYFQMTASSAGAIYLSIGNSKLMFRSGVMFTITTLICIVIGVMLGTIETVALMVSVSFVIKYLIEFIHLIKIGLKQSLLSFFNNFIPELIMTIVMILTSYLLMQIKMDNLYISLIVKLAVSSTVYFILLLILKQWKYLLFIFIKNNNNNA